MDALHQRIFCRFVPGKFCSTLVKGVCGDRFPTPFAKPPGKGLSSPTVNVAWGLFNLVIGYALFSLAQISSNDIASVAAFFAGIAVISIMVSKHFAKKHAA